ncbi:MAG: hypothetical protein FJW37_11075, partial [Acidobacteria bacterium]|nr:hypothetical protein [Acidobacteriota bacterium]
MAKVGCWNENSDHVSSNPPAANRAPRVSRGLSPRVPGARRLLKNGWSLPLGPEGTPARGSVSTGKSTGILPSRDRKGAGFSVFQQTPRTALLAGVLVLPLVALAAQTPAAAPARKSSPARKAAAKPREPLGLAPILWPADNPYSVEKAELGRLLYFDPRLSSDGTVSCATCHSPKFAFTDGAAVSTGIKGQKGGRSAPTVINRAHSLAQFWDG